MPGFQSFSGFLHTFVLAKLVSSSIRVKEITLRKLLNIQMGELKVAPGP